MVHKKNSLKSSASWGLPLLSGVLLSLTSGFFLAGGCGKNYGVGPNTNPAPTDTSTVPGTPSATPVTTSTATPTATATSSGTVVPSSTPTVTVTSTPSATPTTTPTITTTPTATPFTKFEDFENPSGPWATGPAAIDWALLNGYHYDSASFSPQDGASGHSMGLTIIYLLNGSFAEMGFFSQYDETPPGYGGSVNCLLNGTTRPGHMSFWMKTQVLTNFQLFIGDAAGNGSEYMSYIWISPGSWQHVFLPLSTPEWDSIMPSMDFSQMQWVDIWERGPVSGIIPGSPVTNYVNLDAITFTP